MRYRYTDQFPFPAALFAPVTVHVPSRPELRREYQGKIDTAADMVGIPRSFVPARGLPAWGERRIRQTGRVEKTYLVEVEIEGSRYAVEAFVYDSSYVLVGREILNELVLIADGPAEVFELLRPKSRSHRSAHGRGDR